MTAEQRRFEDLMTYFVNNASPNVDFLKAPDPPIPAGECRYCLKVDDHITQLCPYKYDVPKNAILGKGCSVQCVVCGCFQVSSKSTGRKDFPVASMTAWGVLGRAGKVGKK
ncbi:hypothetical protein L3X38_014188 [Prunus dulcis]|uniref:Uncharacterized protein n=1 Tax=Prunus dulcis TaxID=3755 RepID=A0AAD4WPD5_PRUDU|nr:hypothetical protein L3X38_014188 [Prunus dulcis]